MKIIPKDKRPEILAPVGGEEQLTAALRCGADAVYFGLPDFNARRSADNFAGDKLPRTIARCHERGVRVYVTINTLVFDRELADMRKAVDTACGAGADGLIVQDLAVAKYARENWPDTALIASTQMAVHNAEGTALLKEMGFSRAVAARELTLEEIKDIHDRTGMDIEVFVHGAHCMSVSGMCYISSMIGGRSGNRGLCAQPCRLDCSLCGRDHALSLKDLSYIDHIAELADAGVSSLKIEGRMKRAEYVAAAVTACRAVMEGREPDMETLRAVFSRSGFTDGYLTGKRGPDMFGYRTKEDVTAADQVLKDLAKLYEKEPQNIAVDMHLSVREGQPAELTVTDGSVSFSAAGEVPQTPKTLPLTKEYAERYLSKTGGTPYYLNDLKTDIEGAVMLPASQLNELRRKALEGLAEERVKAFGEKDAKEHKNTASKATGNTVPEDAPGMHSKAENKASDASWRGGRENTLRARFESADQLFSGCPDTVILPLKAIDAASVKKAKDCGAELIIAEIPPVVWPSNMKNVRAKLAEIKELNITDVYVENLGALDLAREFGFTAHGGAALNILNSVSMEEHLKLGLADACVSFEMPAADMRRLAHPESAGAAVYGYLPLMKFRACPARGKSGCGDCKGVNILTDRKGERFTVICRDKQYSELLNCVPLYAADRNLPDLSFRLLYFTTETAAECAEMTRLAEEKAPLPGRRTAGLYFRELL
ncbi:MAG: U32 family peptidase [Firmicutes bacterium]|nr:U32 family peptidase [Bacillota bacterium]